MEEKSLEEFTLSFSGCGFLCIYHAGVVAAIKEYAPQLTKNKVCGASAGAVAAVGIVCGVSVSKAASTILAVVSQAHRKLLGPMDSNFQLMNLVRTGLTEILPSNAAELCSGRLAISLTRYRDGTNVIVSDFTSKEDVIDAIVCSCFIPVYCGFTPPYFQGEQYYDGGISDNQPRINDKTITISPFSGESDICPPDLDSASLFGFDFCGTSVRFTSHNLARIFGILIPVSQEACSRMCRQGFEDALRFLTRKGLTPCARCLTIQSCTTPVTNSAATPLTFRKKSFNSSVSFNNRGLPGSECDMCFEKVENTISSSVTTMLFPSIMQKTLDEAVFAENRFISYMFKFKVVRYSWRCMVPMLVPLQYALCGLQKIAYSIASLSRFDLMIEQFKKLILFVTSEFEKVYGPVFSLVYKTMSDINQTLQCAKSCPFPVPDALDCQKILGLPIQTKNPALHSKALVPPPSAVPSVPDSPSFYSHDEVDDSMDSMHNLIRLTQEQEAILTFQYTDDNDQEQFCQIFEVDGLPLHRQPSHCHHVEREKHNLPRVIAESDEAELNVVTESTPTTDSPHAGEDSGFSFAEDNPTPINKRNAACSPVRQFNGNITPSRSGTPGSSRRLANHRRPAPSRVHNTSMLSSNDTSNRTQSLNVFSSDSDPDAGDERLFVPSFRQRNASNEYDGDPEQSDADDQ